MLGLAGELGLKVKGSSMSLRAVSNLALSGRKEVDVVRMWCERPVVVGRDAGNGCRNLGSGLRESQMQGAYASWEASGGMRCAMRGKSTTVEPVEELSRGDSVGGLTRPRRGGRRCRVELSTSTRLDDA